MPKGYMYILQCANGNYYTGSTIDLERRLAQHQAGEGANFTRKHLPVELLYYEEFQRIDEAFYREKQVQGWSRAKKEALIHNCPKELPRLSKNYTQLGISRGLGVTDPSRVSGVTDPSTSSGVSDPSTGSGADKTGSGAGYGLRGRVIDSSGGGITGH